MGRGHMDRESLRLLLGQGESLERIAARFRRHPSTVSYWIAKHGLEANGHAKHAARGGLQREVLERLVGDGLSIGEIAAAVDRSKGTVRHWLRRFDLSTGNRASRRLAGATEPGHELLMQCARHGQTEFVLEGRGSFRCKRCRSERVADHRRRIKQVLVREAGGQCCICGYDRYLGALQFHHLNPREKRHGLSQGGNALALDAMRREAQKCVLLCANCHSEVEAGRATIPVE